MHHRLPVQEDLLQPQERQGAEVHLLLTRASGGPPTVCPRPALGRSRYLFGLFLYDADRVATQAAATPDEGDLYDGQLAPHALLSDPEVIAAARRDGIPDDWMDAARRSPVYALRRPTGWRCRCIRSTARCRWSGTCRRSPSTSCRPRATTRRTRASSSAPSRRCASPLISSRSPSRPVAPTSATVQKLAAMRAYMRDVSLGRTVTCRSGGRSD